MKTLVFVALLLLLAVTDVSSNPMYWGAYIKMPTYWFPSSTDQPLRIFQANSGGKGLSLVHWGLPWFHGGVFQKFPTVYADVVRNYGAIPVLDWSSWDYCCGAIQANWTLATVYSGKYDSYIHSFAQQVKAWGHPLWIRHNHEMNGWWQFPWAEQINSNRPGDYVKAWRHVHDIFTAENVTNVAWVWCPNVINPKTTSLASLYPGDSYVDWTCLDGYNFGPLHPDQWINFTQVFRGSGVNGYLDSYANITAVAPNKPLMLAEFGCAEKLDGGAAKGKWISDALTKEIPSFPAIRAIAWFEWDAEGLPGQPPSNVSWPIETSNAAQAAWASGIQLSNYVQNLFKNLSVAKGNPIPPYSLPTPAPTTTAPPTTVAPTTPPPTTLRPDYVGCYRDQLSPRALLGLTPSTSFFNSTRMTIELCQKFCGLRGYAYSGLQNGKECWCGQVTTGGVKANETECKVACTGANTTICGAYLRNSIYRSLSGFKGCFIDSKNTTTSRDLAVRMESSLNMTIARCIALCKNYTYAGLQWSRECWCGNTYGRYGAAPFAQCNMTCAADSTAMCGSSLRNSIYLVGSSVVRAQSDTTSSSSATHSFPMWAVAVLVVVGVLAAACVLILAIFVYRRRNQNAPIALQEKLLAD